MLFSLLSLAGAASAAALNFTNIHLGDLSHLGGELINIHHFPNMFLEERPLKSLKINDALFGQRAVSYYVTSNNLAVIDGDVTYGPVSSLLAQKAGAAKEKRAFSGQPTWPNAQINWKFDSATTAASIGSLIQSAISTWKSAAPFLRFNQLPNSATLDPGILTVTSLGCDGCHASYGYDAASARIMNMGTNATCGDSCNTPVAVHEFGHVLGLYHEHQRPDRDSHIQYHCDNLAPLCNPGFTMAPNTNCCNNVEPNCCLHSSDFQFFSDPSLDWSGPYDINSLMHYPANLFALPGKNTLTSTDPALSPLPATNVAAPTALDVERVCERNIQQCKPVCRQLQCPPPCKVVTPCPSSHGCRPPRENDSDWSPPPCCDAGLENKDCKDWQGRCQAAGCPSK